MTLIGSTHLIVRYGEIFLKGQNRHLFEKKLVQNILHVAHPPSIQFIRGRIIIPYFKDHFLLRRVFLFPLSLDFMRSLWPW